MNKKIIIFILIILITIVGVILLNRSKVFKAKPIENKDKIQKTLEENPTFWGKVIETGTNYIIVEPDENEEIRKSSDRIHIGLGEHNDELYTVGIKVKITYDGTVMETYPAQINLIKIEPEICKLPLEETSH